MIKRKEITNLKEIKHLRMILNVLFPVEWKNRAMYVADFPNRSILALYEEVLEKYNLLVGVGAILNQLF